jgi:hypothetical protein
MKTRFVEGQTLYPVSLPIKNRRKKSKKKNR